MTNKTTNPGTAEELLVLWERWGELLARKPDKKCGKQLSCGSACFLEAEHAPLPCFCAGDDPFEPGTCSA